MEECTKNSLNHSCSSNQTRNAIKDYDEDLVKVLEKVILSVIFVTAIIGNSVVILVLLIRRKKLSRMKFFILHLSITDICVALFNILSQLIQMVNDTRGIVRLHDKFGIQCRLFFFSQLVPSFASTYMLVSVAVDRFMTICLPMTVYSWTNQRSYWMVFITWLVSFLGASPQLGIFYYHEEKRRCYDVFFADTLHGLGPDGFKYYTVYLMIVLLVIPVGVLVSLNSMTSYVVWISMSQRETTNHNSRVESGYRRKNEHLLPRVHSKRSFSRAKVKTLLMTSVIVIMFILCWTPYWIGTLMWAFKPDSFKNVANLTFVLLSALNSCVNPFVYIFFNTGAIRKVLPCCLPSGRPQSRRLRAGFIERVSWRSATQTTQRSHVYDTDREEEML